MPKSRWRILNTPLSRVVPSFGDSIRMGTETSRVMPRKRESTEPNQAAFPVPSGRIDLEHNLWVRLSIEVFGIQHLPLDLQDVVRVGPAAEPGKCAGGVGIDREGSGLDYHVPLCRPRDRLSETQFCSPFSRNDGVLMAEEREQPRLRRVASARMKRKGPEAG